jgi:hypothetical protein
MDKNLIYHLIFIWLKKQKNKNKKNYELMKFLIQMPYNISRNKKYLLTAG